MTVAELTVVDDLDLDLELAVFATPGAGVMSAEPGENEEGEDPKGPVTVGTTCWGTPCPSANTVSC